MSNGGEYLSKASSDIAHHTVWHKEQKLEKEGVSGGKMEKRGSSGDF